MFILAKMPLILLANDSQAPQFYGGGSTLTIKAHSRPKE
jgi:hypothetical protein